MSQRKTTNESLGRLIYELGSHAVQSEIKDLVNRACWTFSCGSAKGEGFNRCLFRCWKVTDTRKESCPENAKEPRDSNRNKRTSALGNISASRHHPVELDLCILYLGQWGHPLPLLVACNEKTKTHCLAFTARSRGLASRSCHCF